MRIVLAACCAIGILQAQQLRFFGGVTAARVVAGAEVQVTAAVQNAGTAPLRLLVRIDTSQMLPGWMPYFCWGPNCYAPGVVLSPNPVVLPPDSVEHSFKLYLATEPTAEPGVRRVHVTFLEQEQGRPVLEYDVEFTVESPAGAPLQMLWAHSAVQPPPLGRQHFGMRLLNRSAEALELLVEALPEGFQAAAAQVCLGGSCLEVRSAMRLPDTLRLEAGRYTDEVHGWIPADAPTGARLQLRLLEAHSDAVLAEHHLRVESVLAVGEASPQSQCLQLVQRGGRVLLHLPAAAGVLEVWDLFGRLLLRQPVQGSTVAELPTVAAGVYGYRLLRDGVLQCRGVLLLP
jgi:hypothetical protein